MEAPIDKLAEVKGVGNSLATFIHCVGQMMPIFYRVAKTERQCPKYFTRQEFSEFIKAEYADLPYEKFDAYLLDAENRIFDCKRFSIGADGKVRVDTEIFTREIVEAEPSGVVLVHNHPKGNCQPSMQDDTTTETCASICAFHNILLCDHLICAKNGVYSYYESGKLKKARSD
jgi:DNA repair protein RadC